MPPNVYREAGGMFERHSANRTQVGLLFELFIGLFGAFKFVVLSHVDGQRTRLSKGRLAYDARVRFVSRMCRHVSFHVRGSETIPINSI